MRRDPIRFRAVLPIIFAFLAAMLMVWNYENDRVVTSMGIGWDMGPPFWPYQADYLALFAINAPAFVLSMPILRLLELQTLSLQDAIWFPAILALWWWIGTRIDFGVLGRRNLRYPKPLASLLTILSFVLLYIAARVGLDEVHWWTEYGRNSSPYRLPTLLRTAGPVLWCLALATGCLDAAIRLIQLRTTSAAGNRPNYRLLVVGAAAGVLYVFAIHRLDKFLNPPFNYDQCAVDRLYALGCIHGTVVDEGGKRISHIELDLIPALKTGDARWYGTHSEWTDEHGRYNFNRLEPSQYLLGANAFSASGAPNAERPFATAYYPASANESEAATLDVVRSSALQLAPLRLHKLGLAAIKITVRWSAGTRPQRSNIFFKNILYARSVVTAPQIDNGTGVFHSQRDLNTTPLLPSSVMPVRQSNLETPDQINESKS